MDSKDARESLESGGGGARCRCSNGRRKAAAVFVIQSLLTAACAVLSLIIYLSQQPGSSKQHISQDNGIYMQMNLDSDELEFTTIWSQNISLNDKKRVKLSCGGPYMVYLWACVRNYTSEAVANLTIETGTKQTGATLFHLQTLRGEECKEMQKVIMLHEKKEVTVKFRHVKNTIKITELFLGLHYMLGAQCFPYPIDNES